MVETEIIKKLCNELNGDLVTDNFCVVKVGGGYPELRIGSGLLKGVWLGFYHENVADNEFKRISSGWVFNQLCGGEFDKLKCMGRNPRICVLSGKEDEDVIIIKEESPNLDKEDIDVRVRHKGRGIADFHLSKKLY